MSEMKPLTELIGEKSETPASMSKKAKRVLIDNKAITEEAIDNIKTQKESDKNEYLDSLKKGLELQDEYFTEMNNGNMQAVGLPKDAADVPIENTPKVDGYEDDMDDTETSEKASAEIDFSEFVPSYDIDEESPEEDAVKDSDEISGVVKDAKTYAHLPIQTIVHEENDQESFLIKKDPPRVETIKREKSSALSDKSFITALNKIKKSSFSTTTLPLINSGFFVEVQGGGIIDLLQLYKDRLSDTSSIDYDIDRMKTMIKSIKSTTPVIDPLQLTSSIHESDYQLLALAYASATLKNFVIPHTCKNPKCKKDFKIEVLPMDVILNIDEINEKVYQLRNSNDYHENSLLDSDKRLQLSSGAIVTIGHPTFMDYLHRIDSVKKVIEQNEAEGYKFAANIKTVSMIRSIELPNGIKTANAYQIYKSMSLFDESDFAAVDEIIVEMQKNIIVPKFGIKSVKCPICGEENVGIDIGNIDDLVFFHIMVTQF